MPRAVRGGRSSALVAVLGIVGVVAGALLVAALPGDGGTNIPTARPPANEAAGTVATPDVEPTPRPTPEPTAPPTAVPTDEPTPLAAGDVADLCEVFFDIPCALGAGRYAPSRFRPEFAVELGDGWSTVVHREEIVALTREQGTVTFAGKITEAYPSGRTIDPRSRARDIIEAFIATNGVGASDPAGVTIGGRRGLSTDLAPVDDKAVALFATEGSVYNLEPDRTTRIVVVDLKGGGTALIAIEPNGGFKLADILETADPAAGTVRWRSSD